MSRILRGGKVIWEKPFLTGEGNMSHTLANLEYHHFKYDGFRRPGDLHIHYFGTATLSIADGMKTEDGDVFEIAATPFGAALRNPLKAVKPRATGRAASRRCKDSPPQFGLKPIGGRAQGLRTIAHRAGDGAPLPLAPPAQAAPGVPDGRGRARR